MTERSGHVTKRLLERLLKDQQRRAERERKLPYAEKLRILDRLQEERRGSLTPQPARAKPEAGTGVEMNAPSTAGTEA